MGKSMETLTDTQKSIAEFLITWARDHKAGETSELLVDEPELAKALGAPNWKRSYLHDLDMLSSYCARKDYPLVSLYGCDPWTRNARKRHYDPCV